MNQTRFKAVIFDIGGVLVTDLWEPLRNQLAVRYGLPWSELVEFGKKVVWGKEFACNSKNVNESKLYRRLIKEFKIRTSPGALIRMSKPYVCPIAGMKDLLRDLKTHHVKLGICSNNTVFWYKRQSKAINLERYVDQKCIVLSCEVGKKKPAKGIYDAAVKSVNVPRGACIFIDDRLRNVHEAIKLGLTGIHVPESTTPDRTARYIRQLLEGMGVLQAGS